MSLQNTTLFITVWGAAIRDSITQASMDSLIDLLTNDPIYGGNYPVESVKNSFPSQWDFIIREQAQ